MSSLSNQLSALTSTNKGFAHSADTSSNGIGLGFTHSKKHGHAITADNVKRRPSILYDNARQAADVPEVVLRENALEALSTLRDAVGGLDDGDIEKLLDVHSLEFERGTATSQRNKEVDGSIDKLFMVLMTCMVECPSSGEVDDNPLLLASLQIIEYLLRKYEVHSRESNLLVIFLPLLSTYSHLITRVLGLLNLQSVNGGMWAFLRPYAAAESPPVNRGVLAKGAARDEAVFGIIAKMGREAVEVWTQEGEIKSLRRGISAVLSFSASILVEALHIQSKTGPGKSGTAGVQESFVRKIFSLIVGACGSKDKCCEWKEWGRLLASTLATLCPLSDVVREALCDAVVAGVPTGSSTLPFGDVTEEDWSTSAMTDEDAIDDASSAIMTLLSILGSSGIKSKDEEWKYYLPMHPSKQATVDYLGCELPISTYKALSNRKALFPNAVAGAMGTVLGCLCDDESSDEERIGSIGPLLGAIVMHVIERLEKEAMKDLKKKGRELGSDGDLLFLLSVIKESSLSLLWEAKQAGLVAAVAVQTVISYSNLCSYLQSSDCNEQKRCMISHQYKMILESLATVDSAACDRGVAHAVDFVIGESRSDSSSPKDEELLSSLALILGHAESFAAAKKKMSCKGKSTAEVDVAAFLLPPRVALEHADATVRINAIAGLKVMDFASIESDLGSALLRRLSTDTDSTVVASAGEVLVKMFEHYLDGGVAGDVFDDLDFLAEEALTALFRWSLIGKDDNWSPSILVDASRATKLGKNKGDASSLPPLLACLRICGLVGKLILPTSDMIVNAPNQTSHLFHVLFLSLSAHVHAIENKGSLKVVSQAAISAVSQLLDSDHDSLTLQQLLSENTTCFNVIQYLFGSERLSVKEKKLEAPDLIRKRFLWLALHVLSASSQTLTQSRQSITLILHHMRSFTKESHKSPSFQAESQKLVDIMTTCLTVIETEARDELPNALLQLTSVSSSVAFQSVAKPVIESFVNGLGVNNFTGLIALIHACMHPQAQDQIIARLLTLASESFGVRKSADGAAGLLLPLLAMLSHHERAVRQKVMAVLEKFKSVADEAILLVCTHVTDTQSPMWSSMVMDGANALPQLLGYIVTSSKSPLQTQEFLLQSSLSICKDDSGFSNYGCYAASILLSAMEKAGEKVFPLSKRWGVAGKVMFQEFSSAKHGGDSLDQLRDCITTMLKGVIVTDPQSDGQIISIGPSKTGKRVRSYSIGASESFRLLQPYPKDMAEAILQALAPSAPTALTKSVIQFVLTRHSWTTGVFPKLDITLRENIVSALLALRTDQDNESAGQVLFNLPLKASDFLHILRERDISVSENDQLAMVFLADIIRGKLEALGKASDVARISTLLFEHLESISSTNNIDVSDSGGIEYTRLCLMQTLLALHSNYKNELSELSQRHKSSDRKRSRSHSDVGSPSEISSHAKLLVGLVGGDASSVNPLHSVRGKSLSLSLLTCLCEEFPSTVVTSLLPALSSLEGQAVGGALSAIVPAFCSHAKSAGLSLFDLLDIFVTKIVIDIPGSKSLIDQFVNALMELPGSESSSSIASFIACVIALEAFKLQSPSANNDDDSADSNASILHVIANVNSVTKVAVALSLLQYAETLISFICGGSDDVEGDNLRVIGLSVFGTGKQQSSISYASCGQTQKRSILYLTITLLHGVQGIISTPSAKKLVRKSSGSEADLCLRLWQELMQTHVNSLNFHSRQDHNSLDLAEKKFWIAAPIVTNECLENLQNLLPVSHFLASVDSILTDDSVEPFIKKKTIRLLTDRVAEVHHNSPEHSLFLEMVPNLVAQLKPSPESISCKDVYVASRKAIVKQQGALVAIESFVTSLYPSSSAENNRSSNAASTVFLPALASVAELLRNTTSLWLKSRSAGCASESEDAECQLLSSCSLCISSLVASLKARCLHLLPQIIKPLVEALKSTNATLPTGVSEQSLVNLQLAIIRTLSTVAEVLPGFLLPHLPLMFESNALPAVALQHKSGDSESIKSALKQLEVSLATKTPVRQLIPCISNALLNTLKHQENNWEEACTILRVMNVAIENSSRADLTSVVGKIFNALVTAYDSKGDTESCNLLLNANKCLLSLVMKLSEAQLRPLYARLREWRGDIDSGGALSSRRYAFWSLSAELSKALKSIFFPCLTSVITDVVDELECAVSVLCSKKKGGEAKRRRTEDSNDHNIRDAEAVKSIQPLLLCLESVFKADAHEGGDWTRGDDSQRYNTIQSHLGKLLLAQVPSNMTIVSDLSVQEQKTTSAYEMLVQGVGTQERGNVVGCLTALATAAGNEQLWKPLNFAVLEACGHKRSEVRKAGVSCLLSIIESIGEEYMVLLPECLPVLSELLEDADEDIASMARDCVRQGEELLGESLEESLR